LRANVVSSSIILLETNSNMAKTT